MHGFIEQYVLSSIYKLTVGIPNVYLTMCIIKPEGRSLGTCHQLIYSGKNYLQEIINYRV